MSKIAEIVKVRSGYANYVQLRSAFREQEENAERMAMYRPTKGHRTAMQRICRGLLTPNDKKFYLLSGSYGTGKSHLCLMLANLLSKSSDDPGMQEFYSNYAKLDPEQAKTLKNIRKGGQFLVAMCDYGAGLKFEDAVLKAIIEACEERGIATERQTEFDEAERLLVKWEKNSGGVRDFLGDFTKALESVSPGTPVAALRAGLKRYDRTMMDKFHEAYQAAQDAPFQSASGNLVTIVKGLVGSKEFKDKFKGVAVFFDEFGISILQNGKYDPAVMQAFMEDLCKNLANVMFVGCIHKRFQDYADRASKDTASVMSARLTQVDLANEGLEEIIGAIVETDKQSVIWTTEVVPKTGIFDTLTPQCVTLQLFPWIEDTARIRQRVLEDIYGIHPMALHCLLKLSSAVGSDARSTFTFFSGGTENEKGSYAEYISGSEIAAGNGALNLYQTDRLFEFFRKELAPGNQELFEIQRPLINGFVASVQALKKSTSADQLFDEQQDQRVSLLRMILIYSLCEQSTTLENLQFGSYCTTKQEKAAVKGLLDQLATAGAVYLRRPSNTYELCASEGQDPFTLVDAYANRQETDEKADVDELLRQTHYKDDFLPANHWNLTFNEDKRLKRKFVRGRELGVDLWAALEQEAVVAGAKFATAYEGHAVYALCEDEAEITLARDAVKTLPPHGNILVAVTHDPTPFREDLKKVLACRHYVSAEEAGKQPAQSTSRIQNMLDGDEHGYLNILKAIINGVASGSGATWYHEAGKLLVEKPPQPNKPADMLCESLFKERCKINHPDLNFVHEDKWQKSPSLKQAIQELLELSSPVQIDNGNTDNHGQKRYLQKVLFACGALRPLPSGDNELVKAFTAESDASKLDSKFPVLKKLSERLNALTPGGTIALGAFMKEMREPPVGASGTMLALSLAQVVRAFGERLRIFKDSTHTEPAVLGEHDAIIAAVTDRSTKIELGVREITEPQRQFIDAVAKAVGAPALAGGEIRSVTEAFAATRQWWSKLPAVAKVEKLYPADMHSRLESLKQTLSDGHVDRFELMLHRLPEVYSGEPVEAMRTADSQKWAEAFAADVKRLSGGLDSAKRLLAEAILAIHEGTGDMLVCEKVVNEWFAGLTPDQRDTQRCDDDDAQRLLMVLHDSSKPFEQRLTQTLATQWAVGAVGDWTSIRTGEFKAKWELAKQAIENVGPVVPEPCAEPGEHVTSIGPKAWEMEDDAKVRVLLPEGAKAVSYWYGNESASSADGKITAQDDPVITLDPGKKGAGYLRLIAYDNEGNASKPVVYQFGHKKKKHEVVVDGKELFGGDKGTFRVPDSLDSFVEVVKSLTDLALQRKAITQDAADQVRASLDQIKK
jgi:energy-coupling factor transporter ATP-binding protein EcfA2